MLSDVAWNALIAARDLTLFNIGFALPIVLIGIVVRKWKKKN